MLVGPSHEGGSGPDGLKEAVTLFLWTPLVEYRIRGLSFHNKHAKGVERHDLCGLFLRPFRDACDYADTVGWSPHGRITKVGPRIVYATMFYQSHKELAFLIRRHLEVFNGQTGVKFLCSSAIPFPRKRSLPVHTSRISKSPNSSVFVFLLLNAKPLDYLVELTADFGERLLFF